MSCSPLHTTLLTLRSVLFKTFLAGIALVIPLALMIVFGRNLWLPLTLQWFPSTTEPILDTLILDFMLSVRFYLLFVILTPALGLHWHLSCHKPSHNYH